MSPGSAGEIRNLEQQELNQWRGGALKTLVGWTRYGSTEEIVSWSVEAERISREVEAKKRKLQEAIENASTMKDVTGWVSVVVKVQTRRLQAISDWERLAVWKGFGPVE